MLKLLVGLASLLLVGVGVIGMPKTGGSPASAPQASPTQAAAAPPPADGQQSVTMSEGELSSLLSQRLVGQPLGNTPLGQATLERLDVYLKPGQIQADGDAQVGGSTVPVTMAGRVDARNGQPVVSIQDARAAGIQLPDTTRSRLEQVVQSQLEAELQRRQIQVTSITVGDGTLTVVGTRQR